MEIRVQEGATYQTKYWYVALLRVIIIDDRIMKNYLTRL